MSDSLRSKIPWFLLVCIFGSVWVLADWDSVTSHTLEKTIGVASQPSPVPRPAAPVPMEVTSAWESAITP